MTKLDQLLAKLTTSPVEAQQQADPHNAPPIEPEAEIKPKRERRRALNPQPTPGGEARAHAEVWLQAVRNWYTRSSGGFLVDGSGPRRANGSRMQVVGVGGLGGPPIAALHFEQVSTPIGWLSERAVGEAITRSGQPCLERLQKGGGPSTLIDASGRWRTDREATLTCAAAVLALAVELGDLQAQQHLEVVKRAQLPPE